MNGAKRLCSPLTDRPASLKLKLIEEPEQPQTSTRCKGIAMPRAATCLVGSCCSVGHREVAQEKEDIKELKLRDAPVLDVDHEND